MSGLEERVPEFIRLLDSDPQAGMEGFYKFAKRLFEVAPPRTYHRVSVDRREDVFHEIVRHCIDGDFRVLRRYHPLDRATFAGWFAIVASRKITDLLRHDESIASREVANPGNPTDPGASSDDIDPTPNPGPDRIVETDEMRAIVYSALRTLGKRCRLLIRLCARGYKNRQITLMLGRPTEENKRVGTQLADCRKKLVKMLIARGYNLTDFLSTGM